jgi:cyclic pyranopterin phosphate synthase
VLSHVDDKGKPIMVDVGEKEVSLREAHARGFIRLAPETLGLIEANKITKGNVLTTAEIAGIQAAKKTWDLIPLCHPLEVSKIETSCTIEEGGILVRATIRYTGKTGVEMEALTAVSVALLTVYDMCKSVDKGMVIENICLVYKEKKAP